MIGAVIFVIFFLVFLAVTLGVPTLPPGNMIHELLGIPLTETPVLGIPTWLLINAIVNGVVYGFIIWLVYSVIAKTTGVGKKPSQIIQQPISIQEVEIKEKKEEVEEIRQKERIIDLEGIGPNYAKELESAGIKTTEDLLESGSTRKGRRALAKKTGISSKLILEWVNLADLLRIKGVGEEYSDLLEEAGVDTVVELSRRNPENLHAKILEVNEEKKLVRRPPALNQVKQWVEQAKKLPRKVEH